MCLWLCSQEFVRNNRGINDGGDLPEDYMSALYDRIQTHEIKMKVGSYGNNWALLSRPPNANSLEYCCPVLAA